MLGYRAWKAALLRASSRSQIATCHFSTLPEPIEQPVCIKLEMRQQSISAEAAAAAVHRRLSWLAVVNCAVYGARCSYRQRISWVLSSSTAANVSDFLHGAGCFSAKARACISTIYRPTLSFCSPEICMEMHDCSRINDIEHCLRWLWTLPAMLPALLSVHPSSDADSMR